MTCSSLFEGLAIAALVPMLERAPTLDLGPLHLEGAGLRWAARRLDLAPTAALVAAVVYQLSPYVLAYVSRTSVLLLPWAALGWMVGLTQGAATRTRWRDAGLTDLTVAVNVSVLQLLRDPKVRDALARLRVEQPDRAAEVGVQPAHALVLQPQDEERVQCRQHHAEDQRNAEQQSALALSQFTRIFDQFFK